MPRTRLFPALLARRPAKGPAPQQMQMQMKHRLPGTAPGVDHRPVAPELAVSCNPCRDQGDLAQSRFFFGAGMLERSKMPLRTNQHVRRRLRVDVLEREHIRVFVHHLRGNLFCSNLAEQTIGAHWFPPCVSSSSRMTMA